MAVVVLAGCSRPMDSAPVCVERSPQAVAPAHSVGDLLAPTDPGSRLWEQPARFSGPQRERVPTVAWTASELGSWRTPLDGQRTYTSPVLLHYEVPDAIELLIDVQGAAYVDVCTATEQVPTEEDRRMRTQRVPLSAGASGLARIAVPVATVLQENWRDESEPAGLARLEVRFPRSAVAPELLQVAWLSDRTATGRAPVVQASLDAEGVRRPGWAIHPGGRVDVDLPAVGDADRVVAWLASDEPTAIQVRRGEMSVADVRVGSAWQRVEWPVSHAASGDVLTLENHGEATVFVGAPRIARPEQPATNVLVYLVDTLRADHVGVGSTDASVTPTVDRLADEGAWFAQAQSTGSWTKPVIPTVLTGQWPMQHGVGLFSITDRLAPSAPTLQQALGRAGYRVGSFSASPMGSTLSGLEQGFDVAVPPVHWSGALGPLGHPSATQVHDALLDWIDAAPGAPWAAYVHTLEPHAWAQSVYANGSDTPYRTAVADMDAKLDSLLSALEARDQLDDTLVVFLSDHGESFGEHGVVGHGTSLRQAQTHVPLLFWRPGAIPAAVHTQPVSVADVTPTVLELLNLPPLVTADGLSLVSDLGGQSAGPRAGVPAARMRFVQQPDAIALFSWVGLDGLKIIEQAGEAEQYDLASDRCEGSVQTPNPDLQHALQEWQVDQQHRWMAPVDASLDPSDASLLGLLGYGPE